MTISTTIPALLLVLSVAWSFEQAPSHGNILSHPNGSDTAAVVLTHVRIIDGTSAPPKENQTLVIEHGKITAIGNASESKIPEGARTLDLSGRTVLPGLVLLHEHFFNLADPAEHAGHPQPFSVPRLLLAYGMTTVRTAGASNPYIDLNLKRQIDSGQEPGPEMFVTSPYFDGPDTRFIDSKIVRSVEDARQAVRYWAAEGVTSFKAYRWISKEELRAIIDEAHRLGFPVTAHLESVTCREAAELGIDNLEHGFGPCIRRTADSLGTDPGGQRAQRLIRLLVQKRVVLTLTPRGLDSLSDAELDLLDPGVRQRYLLVEAARRSGSAGSSTEVQAQMTMGRSLDLAFAKAGGRLVLGSDAGCCSYGHFAGRSGQRALELLVDEGFLPLEAIRIATLNGATFLGIADRTGSIAMGKEADLLVVRGDPSTHIEDIEHIEAVFNNGILYDPATLLAQVKGTVGWR